MSVLERIRGLFATDEETYDYRCMTCMNRFTDTESHMARVTCPSCGSNDVRSVSS